MIAARPGASLREIAKAAGVSPNTARDVLNRLRSGKDPVPARAQIESNVQVNSLESDGVMSEVSVRRSADRKHSSWEPLSRDPALRSTEAGRFLLRSLSVQTLNAHTWDNVVDAIPKHCTQSVVDVARRCAAMWEALANRLEGSQG